MNYNNSKKLILIGAFFGLVLSLVLCFTQEFDVMFYFTAAPLYLDDLIFKSDGLVSIITFIYFIAIFSLIGCIYSLGLSKKLKVFAIILIVVIHFVLGYFGARSIFDGLPEAISSAFFNKP